MINQKIWEECIVADNGCLIPPRKPTKKGYVQIYAIINNKLEQWMHRVAYIRSKGPIPKGYTIDHLCRNRACVNPEHLEAVTYRENNMRGLSPAIITHLTKICKRGHDMRKLGSYTHRLGGTMCRECRNMHDRMSRKRKKLRQLEGRE